MKRMLCILLLLLCCGMMYGQVDSLISITVTPGAQLPLVEEQFFPSIGGGMDFDMNVKLPFLPLISIFPEITYSYMPTKGGIGCHLTNMGGGIGINLPALGNLSAKLFGSGGYYYGIITDAQYQNGGNIYMSGGAQASWRLSPTFELGVNAKYRFFLDGNGGFLYHGLSTGISSTINFLQSRQLEINNIQYIDIFPVLYKYYNSNNIGSFKIHNAGSEPVSNIEISFFVAKYMDNPTICAGPRALKGGEEAVVNLSALFAETVLNITEATVVSGKVTINYIQNKKKNTSEKSAALRIYDRNAVTWDDDRKVSAYVTFKDPVILDTAKSLARVVSAGSVKAPDPNLGMAMAIHEAFRLYGMTYVKDPTTPFIEFSKNKQSVDYIQFPRSTLQFKSGDCDDLSILYASLFQAVGIDTAFITIPGHIFMAFSLTSSVKEAQRVFSDNKLLIIKDERVWVPVEITSLTVPFSDAWQTGADEWNESAFKKEANLYPLSESWKIYEPVGYVGENVSIPFVSQDKMETAYVKEMGRFVENELTRQADNIIKNTKDTLSLNNKLGTLYARYGKNELSKKYFETALQIKENLLTLVNLGNIYYVNEDYTKALVYYDKAFDLEPENSILLLQLARTKNKLAQYSESSSFFQKLKILDPEMAARYAYLDSSSSTDRASSGKEEILWTE